MVHRVVKVIPGKTAFFVCDIQERFRSVIYEYGSVVATAEKMIEAAAILGVPVVVTEQNPRALGKTVPLALDKLAEGLHPAWSPLAKTKFSMVLPEVLQSLKEWKTESVVLFGIESHVCVLQTALDLLEHGFSVHALVDGVSSCNPQEVPIALSRLQASGGQVTTSESVLFQLMVDSAHPNFRGISALVKKTKESTKESLTKLGGTHL